MNTSKHWSEPFDERYTVTQTLTGLDRGKFNAKFEGIIIAIKDTYQEAIDYTHAYQKIRVQAFECTWPTLLTI